MKEMLAVQGARIIVENCASIKKGEKVFVVTDYETFSSALLIAKAAYAIGADVDMGIMKSRDLDGQEPTECMAAAMERANVVLTPVSKSLAHTIALNNALAAGARALSLTAISEELMASPAFKADFKKQAPVVEKVAQLFTEADELTVTTPAGTDLKVGLKGRKGNAHKCLVNGPGQFSAAPNIEANFSPVEGTTEGIFVSDASIPYLGIGKLSYPITFTIEKGIIVKTEGGIEAEKIKRIWAEQNDPNVYNIAQFAIGLNPEVREAIGVLGCNYDEGAYGAAHIGIGTSTNLGGKVKASTHFDALMNKPTIVLDGEKQILKDGDLLI